MTSESGVLCFLFFWLGPPGVSKAASASYMYGEGVKGGERDRKEEVEERKDRKSGERGRRQEEKEVKRRGTTLKINGITALASSGFPLNNKMKHYLYLYIQRKKFILSSTLVQRK